jgi:hypothetical protein
VTTNAYVAGVYYSQSSSDPADSANWNTAPGGGGTTPANFTSGDTFVITNGYTMTASATPWTVSGNGAKVVVENGGTLAANNVVTVPTLQVKGGGAVNASAVANLVASTLQASVGIGAALVNSSLLVTKLLVDASASLTVAASQTLEIQTSVANSGTVNLSGTLKFDGTNAWSPNGTLTVNNGGVYLTLTPTPSPTPSTTLNPTPATVPGPIDAGPNPPTSSAPTPTPIPAPVTSPATSPSSIAPATSTNSIAPAVVTAIAQTLTTAPAVPVPITASVALGTPNPNAPAKVLTVASAAGTSLAVIITPQGTPAASYLITVTNNLTGAVTSQLVTGSALTQSVAIAGLNPSATYSVAVVANTAGGQSLAVAGKVATPAPIAAPATKITAAVIAASNQSAATVAPFPLTSSTGALVGKSNPAFASGVVATSSSDGTSLALTVLPPGKAGNIASYIVMVTDRTTGIVTTQQVPAGSNPASMALSNLASGDSYSLAVVAVDKNGTQNIVTSSAVVMAGKQVARPATSGVKLAQTPNTTDSANAPRIVKFVPKAVAGSKNQATVEINNLKPGQRIKVTIQKTAPVKSGTATKVGKK